MVMRTHLQLYFYIAGVTLMVVSILFGINDIKHVMLQHLVLSSNGGTI